MFSTVVVPLALAASALANVFITNPVSSSTLSGGQQATVSWIESGTGPSLGDFGIGIFGIYAGNALEQTLLQQIATGVNVSATSSFTFTVDKTIGPDSNEYFIRVTSQTLMSPGSPQFPEEAFSSKFTMADMTGMFNASVQAEINGQSTAPIGGTSTSSASSTTSSASGTSTTMLTSMTGSMTGSMSGMSMPMLTSTSASTTSTAAGSAATNGAGKPALATGLVALVATLVGAALL